MTDKEFSEYVKEQQTKKSSKKFKCKAVTESKNFYHYKYSAGLFVTHQYYMRKVVEGYSYVIDAYGDTLTEDRAKDILNSLKVY